MLRKFLNTKSFLISVKLYRITTSKNVIKTFWKIMRSLLKIVYYRFPSYFNKWMGIFTNTGLAILGILAWEGTWNPKNLATKYYLQWVLNWGPVISVWYLSDWANLARVSKRILILRLRWLDDQVIVTELFALPLIKLKMLVITMLAFHSLKNILST